MHTLKFTIRALTMATFITGLVGCDTAQSIRAQIYLQPKGQVLAVHLDKTGYPELKPLTGAKIVMRVIHEEVDDCPGVNTFKRNTIQLKQAIKDCLSKYPPAPSTFIKGQGRKFVDHNNDGLIYLHVAIPKHWPNLSLLQITTHDGLNYYVHIYTYTSATLAIIIPSTDHTKYEAGWGSTVSE